MTQEQLDGLYQSLTLPSPGQENDFNWDAGLDQYQQAIAPYKQISGWRWEDGHGQFIALLESFGCKVLTDPNRTDDTWSYVVITPEQV